MHLRISMIIALLVLFPHSSRADAGAPMIFLIWPASWVLLLLIVPIEGYIASKIMNLRFGQGCLISLKANLVSTLVGIPITWLILVVIEFLCGFTSAYGLDSFLGRVISVTIQSAWLIPYESDFYWMIPTSVMFMCIPFFFMSVWVEYLVARRCVPSEERHLAIKWAWKANLTTYAIILLLLVIQLISAIHSQKTKKEAYLQTKLRIL